MFTMIGSLVFILGLCVLFYVLLHDSASKVSEVVEGNVFINGTASIAETDHNFICATLDYGPSDHCDHGFCWGKATLLDLDLNNKILQNAVKAFSPLKIRMGGTLQDRMIYETPGDLKPCNPMAVNSSGLFGFSEGCLPMSRWDELHSFFKQTGAIVTFGLNVLYGRSVESSFSVVGDWNSSNAEALLRYTANKGYRILGWELGNELSGKGIGTRLTPEQYASDLKALQNLVNDVYSGFVVKPLIMAPGGFFDRNWFKDFVDLANDTVQVVTHHIYNLGVGADHHLIGKILDPSYLNGVVSPVSGLQDNLQTSRTSAVAWVGEAGGAANSGCHLVTDAFLSSFWYLDQLGIAATRDTKTHCRQTLIGGGYGLLNSSTFLPNPDFYSALLWHRLMGSRVLSTNFLVMKNIRAYSHCSKNSTGITLLLINLDGKMTAKVRVSVKDDSENGTLILPQEGGPSHKDRLSSTSRGSVTNQSFREEYQLTAKAGDLQTQVTVLNGRILNVDSSGNFPELKPMILNQSDVVTIAPYSIVFVRFPGINITACL
ncbi:heparanase-like protein 3 [Punica granatum]|uniref:Heparanase-like protein 3 n=1 Tax=Punica granatum TaxID=22663 RepID=A0A6P8BPJ0_PUNGR|nr:heparanase-like protein 3 [Punica granatum]